MTGLSSLIQAVAALLWPIFAFAFMFLFRSEISDAFGQIKRMRRGKFLGQEIELDEILERDETSRLLGAYLLPNGVYSHERADRLNSFLRDLGIARDVLFLVHGEDCRPMRQQLIHYARSKGLSIDPSSMRSEL